MASGVLSLVPPGEGQLSAKETEPRLSHSTKQSSPMLGRAGRAPVGGGGILQPGPEWRTGRIMAWRFRAVGVEGLLGEAGGEMRAEQAVHDRVAGVVLGESGEVGKISSIVLGAGEERGEARTPRKVSR